MGTKLMLSKIFWPDKTVYSIRKKGTLCTCRFCGCFVANCGTFPNSPQLPAVAATDYRRVVNFPGTLVFQ